MTAELLMQVLLWSAALNYALLILWFAFFSFGRNWLRLVHGRWFRVGDESFDAIHYSLMGVYKLGIFVLNLGPALGLYLAAA